MPRPEHSFGTLSIPKCASASPSWSICAPAQHTCTQPTTVLEASLFVSSATRKALQGVSIMVVTVVCCRCSAKTKHEQRNDDGAFVISRGGARSLRYLLLYHCTF